MGWLDRRRRRPDPPAPGPHVPYPQDGDAPAPRGGATLTGVCKAYGGRTVLDGVDLVLEPGGTYCLMGPSGTGKTTLLRILLGLEPPDAGSVTGAGPGRVAAMFQEDRLCETLTPVENVLLALPPDARRSDARALLEEILPPDCMGLPAMQLSGGMRRRVSLARAVAFGGDTLVLDEPFTGLDRATKQTVVTFLLRHRAGRALLVATHGEEDAALLGAVKIDLAALQGPRESVLLKGGPRP